MERERELTNYTIIWYYGLVNRLPSASSYIQFKFSTSKRKYAWLLNNLRVSVFQSLKKVEVN